MSQNANLCRTVPNGAASGREEKLVESRGVEALHVSNRLAEIEKRTPAGMAKLRAAAAEALLAAGLVMAEIEGERRRQAWEQKPDCQRLLKAMEQLREALS